jgi:hypothetical protein
MRISKESGVSGKYISFEMITFRLLHRPTSKYFIFTKVTRKSNMLLNSQLVRKSLSDDADLKILHTSEFYNIELRFNNCKSLASGN